MTEYFFATCPRGLEQTLADELAGLGAGQIKPLHGGVAFHGEFTFCYRVNLESRIASRVLWRIHEAGYRNEDDVYRVAKAVPWHAYFEQDRSIMVAINARSCPLRSLDFATLRIKDAVCDAFREAKGGRPNVDTQTPDVRIHAFLDEQTLQLYLDTSGEALFKRGQRPHAVDAPIKENLAAGILRLTGWRPGVPLLDPMCGSGTFLLEAAQISLGIAPGMGRGFGFEQLNNFDADAWRRTRHQAEKHRKVPQPLPIYGSDKSGAAVQAARDNLAAAGLTDTVQLKQVDMLETKPPATTGILVTNPPYGVRLGEQEELARFYPQLADVLKQRFAGWTAYIFTADLRFPKLIRLTVSRRTPLFNGPLECRLYELRMVAGSARGKQTG